MMEIIFTTNDNKTIKKNLVDYKNCYVIDARELLSELGYKNGDKINSPHDFIINAELERKFMMAISSKKYSRVLYYLYEVNDIQIKNVRDFMDINYINKTYLTLFDAYNDHNNVHSSFNMVITI
jgi:hypothetical protein